MSTFPKESSDDDKHTAYVEGKTYDVYKLIALAEDLPTELIPMDSLVGFLKEATTWQDGNGSMFGPAAIKEIASFPPNWEEMRQAYPEFAQHIRRIEEENTSHPILILGENRIVDGFHRTTQVWLNEKRKFLQSDSKSCLNQPYT